MKFLILLMLCCIVAKDVSGATISQALAIYKLQMDAAMALSQKKVQEASGGTINTVPTAPKLPTPANPNQEIGTPPKAPLPNPKCDVKALIALLKAIFGRVKGSCSGVKKSKGPLPAQLEAAKKNFTVEISATLAVTTQVSYEFPTCSDVVDPTVKAFQSNAGKCIDAVGAASNGTGNGTSVDISVKNFAISIQSVFLAMNSVTGSAKPAAGSNGADAVAASEGFLSTFLLICKAFLDMMASVATESSVKLGDITKTLSTAVDALSTKTASGSVKILGSVCIEFSASLTTIIKSVSSVDLDGFTKELGTIDSDIGKLTDSAKDCKVDDGTTGETPTDKPADTPTEAPKDTPTPTDAPKDTPTATDAPKDTPTATDAPKDTPTATDAPKDTPTATDAPKNTPTPSMLEILLSISVKIQASFTSITTACAPLKVDAPAIGDKVDGSLKSVSTSLSALLSVVQTSGTASLDQLSTQIDAAMTTLLKAIADFLTQIAAQIATLSKDTSVCGTTAVSALKALVSTTLSITVKVVASLSVGFEKLALFTTPTLDAACTAISKIDVKSVDFASIATGLTAVTSPTEVNADSCTKAVKGLGESATKAVGEIKTGDSGKFELSISFTFNAIGYTLKNFKVPKVVAGIGKVQGSFSLLIKQIMEALSCAEASKGKDGSGEDKDSKAASGEEKDSKAGSGEEETDVKAGSGEDETDAKAGSGEKKDAKAGSGEKTTCKPLTPDNFKLVFAALLTILSESKSATATMDPKALTVFNLSIKTVLTVFSQVFTGLSTKLTEQTIDVSVLLSLGIKVLTTASGADKCDYDAVSASIDGILSYGNVVDESKPALDSVKDCQTKVSAAEPAKAGAALPELSTSASAALTVCGKNVSGLKKYFTKPVDPLSKAVTDISSILGKFTASVSGASGDSAKLTLVLQDFLYQISVSLQLILNSYTDCSASTQLDPKGDNASKGLQYIIKSIVSVVNSILVSVKIVITVPADVTEFYTALGDACGADVSSPDADPSVLGGKVKGICDKYKKADKIGSGEDSGSGADETGEDKSKADSSKAEKSGEAKSKADESGDEVD